MTPARLQVAPVNFPFLAQIRGHEDDRLAVRASSHGRGGLAGLELASLLAGRSDRAPAFRNVPEDRALR